jgi:hypothetical protein
MQSSDHGLGQALQKAGQVVGKVSIGLEASKDAELVLDADEVDGRLVELQRGMSPTARIVLIDRPANLPGIGSGPVWLGDGHDRGADILLAMTNSLA